MATLPHSTLSLPLSRPHSGRRGWKDHFLFLGLSSSALLPLPTHQPRLKALSLRSPFYHARPLVHDSPSTPPPRRLRPPAGTLLGQCTAGYPRQHLRSFALPDEFASHRAHEIAPCVELPLPLLPLLTLPFSRLLAAFLHSFWAGTVGHLAIVSVRVTRSAR